MKKIAPHRCTELAKGEGLRIPVFDMSLTDGKTQGRYQAEPEVLRNSLLELLFEPSELTSLVIVKPDPNDTSHDPLKNIDFAIVVMLKQPSMKILGSFRFGTRRMLFKLTSFLLPKPKPKN